jgi:hypothetical protein
MNIVTAVMTYGADVGGMLASLVALATLCLSLRRPRGKHRKAQVGGGARKDALATACFALSAGPDQGQDTHQPGGLIHPEFHEPEVA